MKLQCTPHHKSETEICYIAPRLRGQEKNAPESFPQARPRPSKYCIALRPAENCTSRVTKLWKVRESGEEPLPFLVLSGSRRFSPVFLELGNPAGSRLPSPSFAYSRAPLYSFAIAGLGFRGRTGTTISLPEEIVVLYSRAHVTGCGAAGAVRGGMVLDWP
jgi:hypothetical protein